ncbi:angiotensin converting enzyme [Penaeus vannamei]|uniref:Angiotensin-converting enzyme n=1 Tax=Penaeus vannamei TaxID=6689 RepID=A0A423U334_PENVA|nr:angiotensin converting enzyme [Penaeus vannamei]
MSGPRYNETVFFWSAPIGITRQVEYARVRKEAWQKAKKWGKVRRHLGEEARRQLEVLAALGTAALPERDLREYANIVSEMSRIYSTATVCSFSDPDKCDLTLDEDVKDILKNSKNSEELAHIWLAWRRNTGRKMRKSYEDLVPLLNKAAAANGFKNKVEMDLRAYESNSFRADVGALWTELKPLYEQLHAYVRARLREVGLAGGVWKRLVTERGPLPAHLLEMFGSDLEIYDLVSPFPNATALNITQEMIKQGYTPQKMFQLADDFFASLGMSRVPDTFWKHSVLERPKSGDIVCHPSAWDFCDGENFRVKQCTQVTLSDLITAHHEMGHIQYFMQYKDQPHIFQRSANPAFHEAVGDLIALSVSTPKHMSTLGLFKKSSQKRQKEIELNFLMKMALDKVAFLPFAYLMDLWRWRVLDGTYPHRDWNCAWWDLRYEIQGMKPPSTRTENDFDPAAKFHVAVNSPYIRYFLSTIIQFQFHKALCMKSQEYDPDNPLKPLHKCDNHQSSEAGSALREMLKLGSSKPWQEVLRILTGEERMDTSALREYFQPLEKWLREENSRRGESVGWRPDGQYCLYKSSEAGPESNCTFAQDSPPVTSTPPSPLAPPAPLLAASTIIPPYTADLPVRPEVIDETIHPSTAASYKAPSTLVPDVGSIASVLLDTAVTPVPDTDDTL